MFAPVTINSRQHGTHVYAAGDGWIVMDGKTRVAMMGHVRTQQQFERRCRNHWRAYTGKLRSLNHD